MKNEKEIKKTASGGNDPDTCGDGSGGFRELISSETKTRKIHWLFISYLLFIVGCSIKDKSESSTLVNRLEVLKILPDSDNDGISDALETQMGTNPLIANIPKISIALVQDIAIGAIFKPIEESFEANKFSFLKQEFSEIDSNKGGDIDLLKVLRKKIVKNQYNHLRNIKAEKIDIVTNEDLRTNLISSWADEQYFPFMDTLLSASSQSENDSGKFVANLKIKITNAKNVTEISDISLKSFFYDYELMSESEIYNHYLLKSSGSKERFKLSGNESYSPVTIYPIIANELKSNEVYSKILARNEIGIKFSDYNYTLLGIQLNYAEVLNKVFDGDAKIIYSDGKKTEVFFVSPNQSLADSLRQLGMSIKLNKDGEIYSLNEIETTAKYPLDIDNLTIDDVKKGIWSVYGDGDALTAELKPQGLYIVSYASVGEILKSNKNWVVISEKTIGDTFKLENIYEGDEVLIELKDITTSSLIESVSQVDRPSVCTGAGCSFVEVTRGPSCNCTVSCFDQVSTPIVVDNPIELSAAAVSSWFSFKDAYGETINAKVFKYGNKIKIKFDSLKSHLRNSIVATFRDPKTKSSTARFGVVGGTCSEMSFTQQSYTNKFTINGSIKVLGINKY